MTYKSDASLLEEIGASRQLLLVVAPGWESSHGCLQCYERGEQGWRPVFSKIPVTLGRSGLAWGRGRAGFAGLEGPKKVEGDGRTPAGVFAITALFGAAPASSPLGRAAKLPYHPATPDLKAIDDSASAYYNQIVDQTTVTPDWRSCENMLRDDSRYEVGAVIAHNSGPVQPEAGSCIFLHVWADDGTPTAGCTAMALADMAALAGWLDAAAEPLLVQLPLAEYDARRTDWGLPLLPEQTRCGDSLQPHG